MPVTILIIKLIIFLLCSLFYVSLREVQLRYGDDDDNDSEYDDDF